MLAVTGAMKGAGRGGDAALDHRRPLLGWHPRVLRRVTSRPKRSTAGRSRSCEEGDRIVIDADAHTIDLMVDEAELERRRADWKPMAPRYTSGFLAKYARLAQGAERGAITNFSTDLRSCPRSSRSRRRAR